MPTHEVANSTEFRLPMRWAPAQIAAAAVGTVFLVVGVLGFIPGCTTHYDQLAFAGHHSGAMLFGIFNVSVLHNIVHLGFGVAGVRSARHFGRAQGYLIGGGIVYLLLWIYGLLVEPGKSLDFVPFNNADNWLHLGLAVAMIGLGLGLFGRRSDTAAVGQVSASNVSR